MTSAWRVTPSRRRGKIVSSPKGQTKDGERRGSLEGAAPRKGQRE